MRTNNLEMVTELGPKNYQKIAHASLPTKKRKVIIGVIDKEKNKKEQSPPSGTYEFMSELRDVAKKALSNEFNFKSTDDIVFSTMDGKKWSKFLLSACGIDTKNLPDICMLDAQNQEYYKHPSSLDPNVPTDGEVLQKVTVSDFMKAYENDTLVKRKYGKGKKTGGIFGTLASYGVLQPAFLIGIVALLLSILFLCCLGFGDDEEEEFVEKEEKKADSEPNSDDSPDEKSETKKDK